MLACKFFFSFSFSFKHSLSQWQAWGSLNQEGESVFIMALIQNPWVPLPHWPDERPCPDVYSLWKWQGAGAGCWHSSPTDRKQGSKAPCCLCSFGKKKERRNSETSHKIWRVHKYKWSVYIKVCVLHCNCGECVYLCVKWCVYLCGLTWMKLCVYLWMSTKKEEGYLLCWPANY